MWVAATASASSIPLGAFAHVLPRPPAAGELSGLDLLRQATAALTDAAGGARLVVGVDDAHLLDDASATLVHQLALSGSASLIVTVRGGQWAPEPIVALWKERLVERLELQPLSRLEVAELVTSVLGGRVHRQVLDRLWQLTQGNVLFLREVVEGAIATGDLVQQGGVWQWPATFTPSPRLTELVRFRLGTLPPAQRRLANLVALGEPLGVSIAAQLVSEPAVVEAERRGIVALEEDGRRRQLRLAHPMYGEVVRVDTPAGEAAMLRRQLAQAQSGWLRRRGDVLRQATLQLDAEGSGDPELLTKAARQATAARDQKLAERLARAAVATGGGFDAQMALAATLNWQGRITEADAVLSRAAGLARTDRDQATLALTWAPNLFWGQGRPEQAQAVLQRAEQAITDVGLTRGLTAVRAGLALFAGRPTDAITMAQGVLDSADASNDARIWAYAFLGPALARCGRTGEALAVTAAGWEALEASQEAASMVGARGTLMQAETMALVLAGRLAQAQDRAADYEEHCRTRAWASWDLPIAWLLQGQIALARGSTTTARHLLGQALTEF
ncbi:MAG TPA: hypothetical protein VHN78_11425, partial [Chloroflexota bacterium]|nr:hypothetical protein [Chloroflexota bacterium]